MNRRALLITLVVFVFALAFAQPGNAYYSSVSGELRDSATDQPWQWGATVQIFFGCNPATWELVGSETVDSSGIFNIGIPGSSAGDVEMCVAASFEAGSAGTPANRIVGPIPNTSEVSGDYGPVIIYTNTGPNAVTLQQLTASAGSFSPAFLALGTVLLGAVSLVAVRRRETQ